MKKLSIFSIVVGFFVLTSSSYAQQKPEKTWLNRFTNPIVHPQRKSQKEAHYIWHPAPPRDLQPTIKHAVTRQVREAQQAKQIFSLYNDARVTRMCREWDGCEEWAKGKYALDNSFRITDAEVEYFFDNGKWIYTLYIETMEDGKRHAYELEKTKKGEKFSLAKEIKEFPGHPDEHIYSQHAGYPEEKEIAQRWQDWFSILKIGADYRDAQHVSWSSRGVEEMIVLWDSQDKQKPIGWARVLYVAIKVNPPENLGPLAIKRIVVVAKQQYRGGPYTYSNGKWKHHIMDRIRF